MPPRIRTFKNSNTPHSVRKGGRLEKIDFGTQKEEIFRVWEGKVPTKLLARWKESGIKGSYNPGTSLARMNKVKALIGYDGSNSVGYCSLCRNLNTHLLKQKIEGAVIVTRYCEDHVPDKIKKV